MSPEQIESLKQELENTKNQMDGLCSSLDAHKGMLNETIQTGLNLRTTVIAFQKANQKVNAELAEAKKQIASLNQQLTDSVARIAQLESVPAIEPAKPEAEAQAA